MSGDVTRGHGADPDLDYVREAIEALLAWPDRSLGADPNLVREVMNMLINSDDLESAAEDSLAEILSDKPAKGSTAP